MTLVNQFLGLRVLCEGARVGRVRDLLFDPESWCLRFAVLSVGPWWRSTLHIVPVGAFDRPDLLFASVACTLTRQDLLSCPLLQARDPALLSIAEVSRFRVVSANSRLGKGLGFLVDDTLQRLTHFSVRARVRGRTRTLQIPTWDILTIVHARQQIAISRTHREIVHQSMRPVRRAS